MLQLDCHQPLAWQMPDLTLMAIEVIHDSAKSSNLAAGDDTCYEH